MGGSKKTLNFEFEDGLPQADYLGHGRSPKLVVATNFLFASWSLGRRAVRLGSLRFKNDRIYVATELLHIL